MLRDHCKRNTNVTEHKFKSKKRLLCCEKWMQGINCVRINQMLVYFLFKYAHISCWWNARRLYSNHPLKKHSICVFQRVSQEMKFNTLCMFLFGITICCVFYVYGEIALNLLLFFFLVIILFSVEFSWFSLNRFDE